MYINEKGIKVIEDLVNNIIEKYENDIDGAAVDGYALACTLKYIIEIETTE